MSDLVDGTAAARRKERREMGWGWRWGASCKRMCARRYVELEGMNEHTNKCLKTCVPHQHITLVCGIHSESGSDAFHENKKSKREVLDDGFCREGGERGARGAITRRKIFLLHEGGCELFRQRRIVF